MELDKIEEIKHRLVVAVMKSLRKYGCIKASIIPYELERADILECIDMASSITRIRFKED